MKSRILYIALCLLFPLGLMAQQADIVTDMQPNVTIHQDSAITQLMTDIIEGTTSETVQISGFRVQVYSSNSQQTAKTEAFNIEKKMREADLQVEIYVQYLPPFWKVRVGDFRTQDEARLMKEEIIRRMPEIKGDTYIVRDQINVKGQKK